VTSRLAAPSGRRLRDHAARAAHEVDAEILGDLDPGQQDVLRTALRQIGSAHGLDFS